MIAKGIQHTDIIIDGETDIGQIPVGWKTLQSCLFDTVPGKFRHSDGGVVNDKILVIKHHGSMKGIGINNNANDQDNGDKNTCAHVARQCRRMISGQAHKKSG